MKLRRKYRAHFLGFELFFSLILICCIIFLFLKLGWVESFSQNLEGIRNGLYGTLAALSGAMLGFVITGLSILLTTGSNPQMDKLKRSKHYKYIFKIFFSTSKYLSLLVIIALTSLVFDNDNKPAIIYVFFINLWALIIVALRLIRCIWVLEKIVTLHVIKS